MLTIPFTCPSILPALWAVNLGVVVPLSLSCIVLMAVIPSAAWRGRLNVPAYALLLFASAFVAYGISKLAGAESIHGTTLGVVISFIFFLLVATAVGSFFGIFFYRQPVEDSTSTVGEAGVSSALPALDKDRQ